MSIESGLSPDLHKKFNQSFILSYPAVTDQDRIDRQKMREALEQARIDYKNNPLALEQIDRYDPNSEYQRLNKNCVNAYKSGDEKNIETAENLFRQRYPLTYQIERNL